jgi:hypothetical protein
VSILKPFVPVLVMLAFVAVSAPSQAAAPNGTYVDAAGAHLASVSVCCSCTGLVTITVVLDDAPTQPLSAQAKSIMAPDLCGIGCLDCPWPFAWTLVGTGVDLAGGGVAGFGATWTMQGAFQGGVLEFHGMPVSPA